MLGLETVLDARLRRYPVGLVTLDLHPPGSFAYVVEGKTLDPDLGGLRRGIGHLYVTEDEAACGRLDLRVVYGVRVIVDRPRGDRRGLPLFLRAREFKPALMAMALDDAQLIWTASRGIEEFPLYVSPYVH